MRKRIFVFLVCIAFSFILVIVNVGAITGDVITGETITGEATSGIIGLNLVLTGFPRLEIISVRNHTYITNESLLLRFIAGGEKTVWYNLDNGNNITVAGPTFFNTTEASHTLYLFANNTAGNVTSRNVTFSINLNEFIILDDEYDSGYESDLNGGWRKRRAKKGLSTDFFDYSSEQLQNLSGVVLHNPGRGRILFHDVINLTDDENPSDNTLDLNSYTGISSRRIEINSTALPNFNKPATLWFYNLSFSNPRILRDGSVCSVSICTQESYTGDVSKTLKFNVTSFSVYTVEETPAGEETSSSSGGGGGGGSSIQDFSLNLERIKISLKQGETKKQEIIITNTGDEKLEIEIEISKLKEFIKIDESKFDLNKGESKTIVLDFLAREDAVQDLYVGKLIVKADGLEKEILVTIEIESKKALFDLSVEIPEKFLYVRPGEEIIGVINLYNLGDLGRVDVFIDYIIRDEDGNDIIIEQESLAVETKAGFLKSLRIPLDVEPGNYIFYVRATYQGEVASASAWFSVTSGENEKSLLEIREDLIILVVIQSLLILFLLIYVLRRLFLIAGWQKRHQNAMSRKRSRK